MGTDADRAAVPERPATPPRPAAPPPSLATSIPAPPAAPPRPAVPPRPSVPPRPVSPPPSAAGPASAVADGTAADGTAGQADMDEETGRAQEAEPTPEDESSPQMPHSREREEAAAERSERASVPAPRDPAHALRPPAPAHLPQPAPPTGEPLTGPRVPALRNGRPQNGRPYSEPEAPEAKGTAGAPPGSRTSDRAADPSPGTGTAPAAPVPPPAPTIPPPPPRVTARFGPASAAGSRGHAPPTVRSVLAAVCLVLGVGLLGGAGAGVLLSGDVDQRPAVAAGFDGARAAWHEIPVDELFPRTLKGEDAGPGGADRRWSRVAVAPDSNCAHAFDPTLAKALAPVGCGRLVRATYVDETSTSVITVGLMFTKADPAAMRDLRERFASQNFADRADLMPRPYAARGTVAAEFGDAQRASWTVRVLRDVPVVVYSVSGFADGRVVTDPQPANDATRKGETSAAAQAGLGHDAQGVADRIERRLREATTQRESGSGGGAHKADKGKDGEAEGDENR
ncbi:hypothetical protein [Streptomyces sp. B15]|uniref:hypothetical protein n=1 Tax=Streptomyces sp. B15 TaxID=1537797 RepID=UPI001B38A3DA|nr:hypothetical protein [Streptomyces sp. B15]MBQ1122028.1 hypothetical protein [Streptomyces sp. B15]